MSIVDEVFQALPVAQWAGGDLWHAPDPELLERLAALTPTGGPPSDRPTTTPEGDARRAAVAAAVAELGPPPKARPGSRYWDRVAERTGLNTDSARRIWRGMRG